MSLLVLLVTALITLYWYWTRNFKYWLKRKVKHDKPLPLVGNNLDFFLLRKSVAQTCAELYWKYPDEKVVGYYRRDRPELIIRDPDIIKRILITDFACFYPRSLFPHKTVEPLMRNLFFADGDLWKLLRQRMTPAFTSGKLKAMFPLIVERSEQLQRCVDDALEAEETRELDARDLMARYTTDFIGAVGFGLQGASLEDDHSEFRKLGKRIFKLGLKDALTLVLKQLFPETFKHLRYLIRIEKQLIDLVTGILKQRNYEPSNRHDFIDLLLECRKKGTIVGESIEKTNADGTPERISLEMTDALIAAQVFVFFAAGFETSSSATSYTLHQLALNPDKLRKVQDEIDRVLAKYENKLCYEAVNEMSYLDWTFREGMRMFPSLGYLIRGCTRPYTIQEVDVTIDEGVAVLIPLQALHNDPKYFEDPEQFRPERFDPKAVDPKTRYSYLPFGDGPRACIGERLGRMQSLAGLAAVLARFHVAPSTRTMLHPRIDPSSHIVQTLQDGLPLNFTHRKTVFASL